MKPNFVRLLRGGTVYTYTVQYDEEDGASFCTVQYSTVQYTVLGYTCIQGYGTVQHAALL